ncbi:DUF2059 domain-containing protein [Roseitranquillus sediminis]|uniref:DUF2059 domain-containing protein n=1 Tax=Roseitranquillus sediminis TaxID=2809051 RepID=UPI001D0BF845|nr:DUF2059 domain-containing protein [Roseitranquillus sediminis]MBM9595509.1 DUF2059 domain-containing protein [Roseitranquillus sediminis]
MRNVARLLAALSVALIMILPAAGMARADGSALWEMLRLDELAAIMAEEGQAYGDDLAEQLFEGGGGPSWDAFVAEQYDPERLIRQIRPMFASALDAAGSDDLEAFYGSDLGQRIVENELEARVAFLDEEVEEAAYEMADAQASADPERSALIEEFIEVNDLVEANVAAALTYSYAFNLGLVDGEAFEGSMTAADALAETWTQEDAIRADNRRWLVAQLSMAFTPLSDEEIREYIEISRSPQGQALNTAFFTAFEPALTDIARALGEGVARFMAGRDI